MPREIKGDTDFNDNDLQSVKSAEFSPQAGGGSVANNSLFIDSDVSDFVAHKDSGGNVSHIVAPPIGAILPWAKSISGVPSLPTGWVECDGSVLSDSESLLDGQTMPDLNAGQNKFLRGAGTSGGTGGEDTHTLVTGEMPSHTHAISDGGTTPNTGGSGFFRTVNSSAAGVATPPSIGGDGAHENKPPYYEVVWIIRTK